MTFDRSKPIQTRNGRPVRIIGDDLKGRYPLAAAVLDEDKGENLHCYTIGGRFYADYYEPHPLDLINMPPRKHAGWLNIFGDEDGRRWVGTDIFGSRDLADYTMQQRQSGLVPAKRIACIQIRFEEGEGLTRATFDDPEEGDF